ncbi:hypothetical protein [Avibacterium sp. 21-599]|uniref:hypothetical protein n=1 Tax=Avibacterium sp. 21-599 TaxID=2911528 RepID=UPI00224840CC|nr:hypothetical protein [Avibacterium sp. 21-599]MCW9718874.1 hypothetical protein [Avibacterium sp. 21-599]
MINRRLILLNLALLISPWGIANDYSVDDYYQAKLEVRYEGEVGAFAQDLAQQLHIPYYTYQAEVQRVIYVQQDETNSLANLISIINKQLPTSVISLKKIGDQVTLMLEKKPLQSKEKNYIGPIVIGKSQKGNLLAEDAGKRADHQVNSLSPDEVKAREIEAEKIKSILAMSQDKKLIQQYSRRKQPEYRVESEEEKQKIGLETIKSTKISTFLVFNDQINLKDYQIKGDFQDFAKLDNVAVILHRQKKPPMVITIIAPNGHEAILKY